MSLRLDTKQAVSRCKNSENQQVQNEREATFQPKVTSMQGPTKVLKENFKGRYLE